MRSNLTRRLLLSLTICLSICLNIKVSYAQTGHVLEAIGPINQSMGGAGVALPLDSLGSMYWNSASIVGLQNDEFGFSFQIFAPETSIYSSVAANSFGPGIPGIDLTCSTASDTDISPIPSIAYVHHIENSGWSYGISGFGVGGFGVDFPGEQNNPITTPQPPNGFGFGSIYSQFQLLQITTALAYRFNDCFSIGFGLNGDWGTLSVAPFSAAIPDDANMDGIRTYPNGSRGDASWGMGFQTGLYYQDVDNGLHLGVSYKSPQWLQSFQMNSMNELGVGRTIEFNLNYPSILSLGIGYSGFDRWKFATDLRYIDYLNTSGFQTAGFDANGAVTGFGWQSIFVFATGIQFEVSPRFHLRCGYTFNENPVRDADTFFNIPAPALVQHHLGAGFSYETPHQWLFSMAFHHGFQNSVSGNWYSPAGPIPGTNVMTELATYGLTIGISRKF